LIRKISDILKEKERTFPVLDKRPLFTAGGLMVRRIVQAIHWLDYRVCAFGMWFIAIMMFLTTFDVIGRSFFTAPIPGTFRAEQIHAGDNRPEELGVILQDERAQLEASPTSKA
jgi:hypothetical protein